MQTVLITDECIEYLKTIKALADILKNNSDKSMTDDIKNVIVDMSTSIDVSDKVMSLTCEGLRSNNQSETKDVNKFSYDVIKDDGTIECDLSAENDKQLKDIYKLCGENINILRKFDNNGNVIYKSDKTIVPKSLLAEDCRRIPVKIDEIKKRSEGKSVIDRNKNEKHMKTKRKKEKNKKIVKRQKKSV